MSAKPARPRQATVAAGLIMGGSLFVVLSVFERVSGLHSLETREAVQEFLGKPPGEGLGLSVQDVLDMLKVLSMVAGACATAAGILGFYVLQRSRGARLALSVLAVPLFLTGMAAGGFVSSVVAAAVVVLWMQPTRAWFDGKPPPERPARPAASSRSPERSPSQPTPPPTTPSTQAPVTPEPPSSEPRAWQGFGSSPARPTGPGASQVTEQAPEQVTEQAPPHDARGASRRPGGLVWACALTWAGAGLAAAGMALVVLVVLVAPEFVLDQVRRSPELEEQGLSDSTIRTSLVVTGVVVTVWSVLAAVLAGFAWRGAPWARIGLIVSAVLAGLLSLVSVLTNPLSIVSLAACAATVVLLLRPEVREFFARR